MNTENRKNGLKIAFKLLRTVVRFSLIIFIAMLDASIKNNRKKYKPTSHEIMCGEKLPFTGKYFLPDEK